DNWVKLDASLNSGSGSGDAYVYIPDQAFTGGQYVYLYCKFGVNEANDSGYEEWAVSKSSSGAPSPGSPTGQILGFAFQDTNGNATLDAGEPRLTAGVTVFLDANGNGVADAGEASAVTGADGSYTFGGLAAGLPGYTNYSVRALPPGGWSQ